MKNDVNPIEVGCTSYPPLDELIARIDEQIKERPHPYATEGFEAFLGSQLGSLKSRGQQYLRFFLHKTQFALPMQHTSEIKYRTDITPLPNVPPWVLGISNLRGEIISVVDLCQVLGLPRQGGTLGAHLVLIRNGNMSTGILVDKIAGTIFDDDPQHPIEKRVPQNEALKQFVSTIFVDGPDKIYLLAVPPLMAALALH